MEYIVRKGDSLSKIAARFGLPLGKLLAANPQIVNPDAIAVGQRIFVPIAGGGVVVPSTPTPALPPPTAGATDAGLAWGAKVSPVFRQKVVALAARLGVDASDLMSVMAFESGETFSPAVRNKFSGAVGLIQFMPSTAKGLGTTSAALANLTAEEQLDFVARYFKPFVGKLATLEDLYMAVLWPAAVGRPNSHVLFAAPSVQYKQNAGLDADGDGRITKAEAAAKVREKRKRGAQFATPAAPRSLGRRPPRARGLRQPTARRGRALEAVADPIRHVVVLMLENRSFDQALGSLQLSFAARGAQLDGIDPTTRLRQNFLQSGPPFQQLPLTPAHRDLALKMPDPMHERANVKLQLGNDNSYFVLDYALSYPKTTQEDRELVMGYFLPGELPALHALADAFTVCDQWHASVPGPTWTNRFFAHSGTSIGRVEMPKGVFEPNLHLYNQDTVYDRLNERGIEWRIYYGDVPHSMVLTHQWTPSNAWRYSRFSNFAGDAAGPEADFPAFVFVEPSYMGDEANDDHPPHDVLRGQQLIADVYNAIAGNKKLFESTLLVVLYDEHGGFYDHVVPPAAVAPDSHHEEYDFRQLGVRVPAVLVSPWVGKGVVESTRFDHTSVLRYVSDKWALGPLGERTAAANSIAVALRDTRRTDTPASIAGGPRGPRAATRAALGRPRRATRPNEHQAALQLFSQYLASIELHGEAPAPVSRARGLRAIAADPAQRRVEQFLERQARLAPAASSRRGRSRKKPSRSRAKRSPRRPR